MARKASNTGLRNANRTKKDEFYTQLSDIEKELKHYKKQLKNKVIYCNADDPFESNFFKYFASNFNALGLKKLIVTSYAGSPIVGNQLSLLDVEGLKKAEKKEPMKIEINEVKDNNNDGAINLADVEWLLKNDKNIATPLKNDGDFRSKESIEILKEADIVVTNPPFSLFRDYVAQLMEHGKKFLIIGNQNAITYKEIFQLIKENKFWFDQVIKQDSFIYQIKYHSLIKIFEVIDIHGNKKNFEEKKEAIKFLLDSKEITIDNYNILKNTILKIWVELDKNRLPKAIQVDVFNKSWDIQSNIIFYDMSRL